MGVFHHHISLKPINDEDRLRKLYSYKILDTPQEDTFDKIARLAADIFDATNAYISFVDDDRVFFKSEIGHDKICQSVAREESLCSWAILQEEPTVITDVRNFSDVIAMPDILISHYVGCYAAAPLQTADGYRLGTLCVTNLTPIEINKKQLDMLRTLAAVVMDELEFKLAIRKAIRVQTDLTNIAIHDLKNPLTSIRLYAQVIQRDYSGQVALQNMAERILKSSGFILQSLNDLLNLSQIEDGAMRLKIESCMLGSVLPSILSDFEIIASQKRQFICYHNNVTKPIAADKMRLREIFENLLSNASKYSYPGASITVRVEEQDDSALIKVVDEGQGLSDQDKEKLFRKFARLSAIPTGKEGSNGLGLSIVKTLVELHNGKIWAESEGKGRGTTFCVLLPFVYQEKEELFT